MDKKEIAYLASWTAKAIKDTLTQDGRQLDDAGEDIIREYVQTDLTNWERGEKITLDSSSKLVAKILERRRHETNTLSEVCNALMVLCSKFPEFVEENLREREAEARRLAASMPAIKV